MGSDFKGHLRKKITPEWQSAFRVGAGLNFPRSGFDIIGLWTQFSSESSASKRAKKGTNLLTLWAHPDANATALATSAQGKWNLCLNSVDLEWGRSSWFGGNFSIRPFFGARWLSIDQSLHHHYDYATTPLVTGKLRSTSDFNGGGLRVGADLRYSLGAGFSLVGLASGSLLYGESSFNFQLREDQTPIGKSKSHCVEGMSTLQMNLSLTWDTHFCSDRCHIEFHLGWEQNAYFNANRMSHYAFFTTGPRRVLSGKGNSFVARTCHWRSIRLLVVGGREE